MKTLYVLDAFNGLIHGTFCEISLSNLHYILQFLWLHNIRLSPTTYTIFKAHLMKQ